jgi:hypothetical protein
MTERMQFELEFTDDGRLALIRTWGCATIEGCREYFEALFNHPQWHDEIDTLADHRELDPSRLSSDDLRSLASLTRVMATQIGSGRLAMVVSTPLSFGLARMWMALTEPHADGETRVFYSYDEARDWLLRPEPEARKQGEGSLSD